MGVGRDEVRNRQGRLHRAYRLCRLDGLRMGEERRGLRLRRRGLGVLRREGPVARHRKFAAPDGCQGMAQDGMDVLRAEDREALFRASPFAQQGAGAVREDEGDIQAGARQGRHPVRGEGSSGGMEQGLERRHGTHAQLFGRAHPRFVLPQRPDERDDGAAP